MNNNFKRIKVMHIINSLDIGGMETVLVKMLKFFDSGRFITYVCCLGKKGELVNDLEKRGIEVFFVTKRGKLDFFKVFRLARLLREKKIDIVHTYSGVYRDGAIAAKLAGASRIFHTDQGRFYPDNAITKFYHRILTNYFRDKVIAVSRDLKTYLSKKVKLNPSKIIVITNGIETGRSLGDFDRNKYRENLGLSEGDLVFGTVARLAPVKDHNTLIEAGSKVFDEVPNAKLLVIGDGPLRGKLEIKTRNLKIADRVIFLGRRRDIPELLSILDLFVLSSRHEGTSLSILEAMAKGLAVVATNVGGNPEVVVNNVTGLLVEPANPNSLARGIIEILRNREKRMEFGIKAKRRVSEKFNIEKTAKQHEALYNSCFPLRTGKIKVMHLASNPEWAGAEVHIATLANSLKNDKGVEVSACLFHNGRLVDYLKERAIETDIIKLKWLFDVSSIFKLAKLLRDKRIDILHTHGYKANIIGGIASKLNRKNICIRTEHGLTEPFYGFDRLKMNLYKYLDYLSGKFFTKKIISVSSDINKNIMSKYSNSKEKINEENIKVN